MRVTEFLDTPFLYACRRLFFGAKESFYADPEASLERACKKTFNLDPGFAFSCRRMICEYPSEFYPYGDGLGCLIYRPEHPKGAFLVVPGGGYEILAIGEAAPFVKPLLQAGYIVCLAMYSTKKAAKWPAPLLDIIQAEKILLSHCPEARGQVTVMGFSAGGHLAANFAERQWAEAYHYPRPNHLILGYPVISLDLPTHKESKEFITGKDVSLIEPLSAEKHIDGSYPPTFVWRCESDPIVPIVNSDSFVESLQKADIPHQYVIYPGDGHGWGIGTETTAANWLQKAIQFIENH